MKNEGKVYCKCLGKIDYCADILEELWNTQICCCVQRIVGVGIILFSKSKLQSSRSSHKVKCSADINSHLFLHVGSAERWYKCLKPHCIHLRSQLHILDNTLRISEYSSVPISASIWPKSPFLLRVPQILLQTLLLFTALLTASKCISLWGVSLQAYTGSFYFLHHSGTQNSLKYDPGERPPTVCSSPYRNKEQSKGGIASTWVESL